MVENMKVRTRLTLGFDVAATQGASIAVIAALQMARLCERPA